MFRIHVLYLSLLLCIVSCKTSSTGGKGPTEPPVPNHPDNPAAQPTGLPSGSVATGDMTALELISPASDIILEQTPGKAAIRVAAVLVKPSERVTLRVDELDFSIKVLAPDRCTNFFQLQISATENFVAYNFSSADILDCKADITAVVRNQPKLTASLPIHVSVREKSSPIIEFGGIGFKQPIELRYGEKSVRVPITLRNADPATAVVHLVDPVCGIRTNGPIQTLLVSGPPSGSEDLTCESTITAEVNGKTSNALQLKSRVVLDRSILPITVKSNEQSVLVKGISTPVSISSDRLAFGYEDFSTEIVESTCSNFFTLSADKSSLRYPTTSTANCQARLRFSGLVNKVRILEVPVSIQVVEGIRIAPSPAINYKVTAVKSGAARELLTFAATNNDGPLAGVEFIVQTSDACRTYFRMNGGKLIADAPAGTAETTCPLTISAKNQLVGTPSALTVTIYSADLPFLKWCNYKTNDDKKNTADLILWTQFSGGCDIGTFESDPKSCEAHALDLSKPARLNLGGCGIRSLEPLTDVPSLTILEAFDNQIADLSPLKDLKSLAILYLGKNQIVDPSPLIGIASLRWLGLSANPLTNQDVINSLAAKTTLYYLGFRGTNMKCPAQAGVSLCAKERNTTETNFKLMPWQSANGSKFFSYRTSADFDNDDSIVYTADGISPARTIRTTVEGPSLTYYRIAGGLVLMSGNDDGTYRVSLFRDLGVHF